MKCSTCRKKAVIKQGNQHLCEIHYRIGQMRHNAKRNDKYSPSREELERIIPHKMKCPDCGVKMNWRSSQGRATVATLQHYRDGTISIVCLSCNTRHAAMPGDSYRQISKDHKYCPNCKTVKHENFFSPDISRRGVRKIKSYCKECSIVFSAQWKKDNRLKYNQYQKDYRKRRKEEGRPICQSKAKK